jgi:rod shape-determining protein MreD
MTPRRVIAAAAAVITVLVLQAVVVSPVAGMVMVSLPAVLVAALAVEAGPSAGMSVGFCAGLLADLGSRHPAGVLALAWLLLGAGCGMFAAPRRRLVRSLFITTAATTAVSLAVAAALAALDAPKLSLNELASFAVPTALATTAIGLVVVPSVRVMVRALKVKVRAPARRSAIAPIPRVAVDG